MFKQLCKHLFYFNIEHNPGITKCRVDLSVFGIKFKYRIAKPLTNKFICKVLGVKTLLIIRTDGIGDYILTRPFFKSIKESQKYKDYKIIFAGKPNFVSLAKKYDNEYISDYIIINTNDLFELKSLFKNAKKMNFDIVVNPMDSKTNWIGEKFVKLVKSKQKIGHIGIYGKQDIKNLNKAKKVINKYDYLIDTGSECNFMLEKNKAFFEKLINQKIPDINLLSDAQFSEPDISHKYVIISPFANDEKRIYGYKNFVKIIDFLTQNYKTNVVIIGSESEYEKAKKIRTSCVDANKVFNLAGKLSLAESLMYIKYADLLIANETGTVHLAQNFSVKTVCISNGSYMGIFQPYPTPTSVTYVYPNNIMQYLLEHKEYGNASSYDINKIPAEKVLNCIENIFRNKTKFSAEDFIQQ